MSAREIRVDPVTFTAKCEVSKLSLGAALAPNGKPKVYSYTSAYPHYSLASCPNE